MEIILKMVKGFEIWGCVDDKFTIYKDFVSLNSKICQFNQALLGCDTDFSNFKMLRISSLQSRKIGNIKFVIRISTITIILKVLKLPFKRYHV